MNVQARAPLNSAQGVLRIVQRTRSPAPQMALSKGGDAAYRVALLSRTRSSFKCIG